MTPRTTATLGCAVALVVAATVQYKRHVDAALRRTQAHAILAAAAARGEPVLRVPHVTGGITLDGDTDDAGWLRAPGPARTGPFITREGKPARPYSEARVAWGGDYLYLALYASDEDIETHVDRPDGPVSDEDAFRVVFTRGDVDYSIEVSPKLVMTDAIRRGGGAWDYAWNSGAHASMEIDGTVNEPKNTDEEWAIEMAVPFEALGLSGVPGELIGMALSRCDTPRHGQRVCGSWGAEQNGHARGLIALE